MAGQARVRWSTRTGVVHIMAIGCYSKFSSFSLAVHKMKTVGMQPSSNSGRPPGARKQGVAHARSSVLRLCRCAPTLWGDWREAHSLAIACRNKVRDDYL